MYFQTVLVLFLASFVAAAPMRVTLRVGGIITGGSSIVSAMNVVDQHHEMARPQLHGGLDSDSEHASHMLPPAGAQVMLGEKPVPEPSSSSPSATIGDILKTWSCNLSGAVQKFSVKLRFHFGPKASHVRLHQRKLLRSRHP
ncbi:hypothetical protein PTI98_008793 [Pleurotus ostreatus]|nr:hypothetical protein PTI98_008793 [Pleurotus ostreatus]